MSLASLFLVACLAQEAEPVAAPPEPPMPTTTPAPLTEAERHVRSLSLRSSPAHRERARTWFLEHPDEGLPALLAAVEAQGSSAKYSMGVLAELDRAEAIPVLVSLLSQGDELLSHPAAQSLARHSDPSVTEQLVLALDGPDHTRRAALDALSTRADPGACEAVGLCLSHDDAPTRFRAARTAHALGCLSAEQRATLAADPSEDVRELIKGLDWGDK